MKPTKADREAAVKLDNAGLLHCNSDGRLLGQKWLDQVATIIARRMAPERERADTTGVELALHQHEVKKLWERARRVDKALTDLHEWASNKAAEHDGPRENCCDFCWSVLAAAEALETK